MATAQVLKGSGAGPLSGSTLAGRGDTLVITSESADEAGSGGCHGAKPGERERVSGQRENLASKSSGVGGSEGDRNVTGVEENPGADCQGVGGGVDLPRGTETTGVEELPRGDKTFRVTPKGDIVPGEDTQGRGGD